MSGGSFVDGDFEYSVEDGRARLVSYKGCDGCVAIPENLGGYVVSHIGKSAFYFSRLTAVSLPNSVISIGEGAFNRCRSLKEVILSDSIESIGECAFAGCRSLREVIIPNSITRIGEGAFASCNLQKIRIVDSVTCLEDDFVRIVVV